MLTPQYYLVEETDPFKIAVNHFIDIVTMSDLHHPLQLENGFIPEYSVPINGEFGAGKGPGGTSEHHPAIDLHVGDAETEVEIHAAHAGIVSVGRDAPMYRQYVAVSTDVFDEQNQLTGKLVTVYAHVDLDLDEADSLFVDGISVQAGELISAHLYSGTMGGPHLHFEIRYYRTGDSGDEKFYGGNGPGWTPNLSEPSAGPWEYGFWDPDVGYGYGHPLLHGVTPPETGMTDCDTDSFALYGASPNPAISNANVNLVFSIPAESFTELRVYDLSGRTVFSENSEYAPETHELIIEGLASGVYLVQMTSADFTATQNFVVLR